MEKALKIDVPIEYLKELSNAKNKNEFEKLKIFLAKKYGIPVLKTMELIKLIKEKIGIDITENIKSKTIRASSGVLIITLATKPGNCGGNCIYCPTFSNVPKSYTPNEPAIQRAKRFEYDPYLQVKNRLMHYELMGLLKENSKIEVIILGTFLALDEEYKKWFIKRIFDALNEEDSDSLEEAQMKNEKAKYRCVALTIETRPDLCFEKHVDEMLSYGVTRVEIGVQSVYNDVLEFVRRNHTIEDVIKATKIARNAALKITYHIMLNLPKSDIDRDLEMFRILFEDENFRPDYLKIYPLQLFKNTELWKLYERKEFKLYEFDELVNLLAKSFKFIPKYVRVQRLGRDLPKNDIDAGYTFTNLREYVEKRAKEMGIECKCIRCREVGIRIKNGVKPHLESIHLERIDYIANNGNEIFLSFEDKFETIYAYLRLRIPDTSHRKEIDSRSALIRELKVLGFHLPINSLPLEFNFQHRGFGKKLMKIAEEIALNEFDRKKMVVISAIGTREYYRKLGYELEGPYMVKILE
ncbi:MAG: tRNA uridine(34) 5-carboxymethylaminomethyl modification radical SAM/GNAT enzyme Elp3 [Candidatus Aenigmatarchaeota archaeon]